jgi:hypothetical protein
MIKFSLPSQDVDRRSGKIDVKQVLRSARPALQAAQQFQIPSIPPAREVERRVDFRTRTATAIPEKRVLQTVGNMLGDYARQLGCGMPRVSILRDLPDAQRNTVKQAEYLIRFRGPQGVHQAITVVAGYDLAADQFLPPRTFRDSLNQEQLFTEAGIGSFNAKKGVYTLPAMPAPQKSLVPTFRPADRIRTWGSRSTAVLEEGRVRYHVEPEVGIEAQPGAKVYTLRTPSGETCATFTIKEGNFGDLQPPVEQLLEEQREALVEYLETLPPGEVRLSSEILGLLPAERAATLVREYFQKIKGGPGSPATELPSTTELPPTMASVEKISDFRMDDEVADPVGGKTYKVRAVNPGSGMTLVDPTTQEEFFVGEEDAKKMQKKLPTGVPGMTGTFSFFNRRAAEVDSLSLGETPAVIGPSVDSLDLGAAEGQQRPSLEEYVAYYKAHPDELIAWLRTHTVV